LLDSLLQELGVIISEEINNNSLKKILK